MRPQLNIDIIYRTYIDDLYAYALNMGFDKQTSLDAIHDVFYKICLDTNILSNVQNIKFYLLRSIKNRLFDIHRAKREAVDIDHVNEVDHLHFHLRVSVEDLLIVEEEAGQVQQKIENLLNKLTDRQREIIYLRYTQELDYTEIADLMNITVSSCRKLVHKALSELRRSEIQTLLIVLSISSIL